jgi:hypothetical protein
MRAGLRPGEGPLPIGPIAPIRNGLDASSSGIRLCLFFYSL